MSSRKKEKELEQLLGKVDQAMAQATRIDEYEIAKLLVAVGQLLAQKIQGHRSNRKRK